MMETRFVHTNLIANDWQKLSQFYFKVFDCKVVLSVREYKSIELDNGTGLKDVKLEGVHLRLPGYNEHGPTLEIFTYTPQVKGINKPVNSPGFGHIAFSVDEVKEIRKLVLANGGTAVGKTVTLEVSTGDKVTWCYPRDPEGIILELQNWVKV